MHFRMQRLHPPAQHFRPPGQLRHIEHRHTTLAQQSRRAPSRNNLHSQRLQLPRKFHHSRLVKHAHQRPPHARFSRHDSSSPQSPASVCVCVKIRKGVPPLLAFVGAVREPPAVGKRT